MVSKPCSRRECPNQAVKLYCSRPCAAKANAEKKGHAFFVAIGVKGRAAIRKRGVMVLTRSDTLLDGGRAVSGSGAASVRPRLFGRLQRPGDRQAATAGEGISALPARRSCPS